MDKTYYTCIAKNVKGGITKNGNPWRKFGLVVQDGPKKGQWLNFFRVLTSKTLPYYRKDAAAMGVTNDDPDDFQCDGRLVTAVWAEHTYNGTTEFQVTGVLPYDKKKAGNRVEAPEVEETSNGIPF